VAALGDGAEAPAKIDEVDVIRVVRSAVPLGQFAVVTMARIGDGFEASHHWVLRPRNSVAGDAPARVIRAARSYVLCPPNLCLL
jgi:hypothetical protein